MNRTREERTIRAMVGIYCRGHHAPDSPPCEDCAELLDYALERLQHCPWGAHKTTCAACPVHCYRPEMQDRVQRVMRYAGPRMLYCHPFLAVLHVVEMLKGPPKLPEEDEIE